MKGKFWLFLQLLCARIIKCRNVTRYVQILDVQSSDTDYSVDTLVYSYGKNKTKSMAISPLISVELQNYIGGVIRTKCREYLIFGKVFSVDIKAFLLDGTWKTATHQETTLNLIVNTFLMVIPLENTETRLGIYDSKNKKIIATFSSANAVLDAVNDSKEILRHFILSGKQFPAQVVYSGNNSQITITLKKPKKPKKSNKLSS